MGKKKNLTNKEFEQIKLLLQAGLSKNKVATITGRSAATVANAKQFNTLKEMRAFQNESRRKYRPHKEVSVNGNSFTIEVEAETELSVLKEIRDLLKEQKNKKRLF